MAEKSQVTNEDQAWTLLETWLETGALPDVEFNGWPVLRISVEGDEYESSLNSRQMAALVEFKMTIGRAYAMVAHGAYDMRRLRAEEEEELDFSTQVKQGSSILETDLTPLVQALTSVVTMYPGATLVVGLILGLACVAKPVILKHYEARAEELQAAERARLLNLGLSQREQDKYSLYERALEKVAATHPQIHQALPDTRHAFWRLATASANADRMNVSGIDFSGDDLAILSERRGRRRADVEELTRRFVVVGINKVQNSYRVRLESPGMAVTATYRRPYMTEGRVRQLFKCITESQSITATLEIKTVEKSQLSARLLRFKVEQTDPKANVA